MPPAQPVGDSQDIPIDTPEATTPNRSAPAARPEWMSAVARFQKPDGRRAWIQVATSHGAYVLAWVAMLFLWQVAWWLAVPMAVLAGGLLVRVFIVFHDCGHGSFLRSTRTNTWIGRISGVLTWTPFEHWRGEHARHHATSGDLDRRGTGDVWTMTVDEYVAAPRSRRILYRASRSPLILFLLAPIFVFGVYQRFASRDASPEERASVWWTNAAVVALGLIVSAFVGFVPYLVLQSIVLAVAGAAGLWLFYVQHQFDGAYWSRNADWDHAQSALAGSSFYDLPRVLQWFSGNIGFHHVHHLSPRIPNYHLEACHRSHPMFQVAPRITLRTGWRSATLRLWDESSSRLVGYDVARRRRQAA